MEENSIVNLYAILQPASGKQWRKQEYPAETIA